MLSGAIGAVTERLGIATAATNHNTRHLLATATMATTMHRLTGGRFALGLGRGFDFLFDVINLPRITNAQIEDAVGIYRRLWHGEVVMGHDGPAGTYSVLHQDARFAEDIPVILCALAERTLERAGGFVDGVVLHTYFTDDTLARSVAAVRRGAEQAGRDPASVRVWSVLGTVGDHIPYDLQLKKTVGRLSTYLQGYGDLLVRREPLGSRTCSRASAPTTSSRRSPVRSTRSAPPSSSSTSPRSSPTSGWPRPRSGRRPCARSACSTSSPPAPTA